MPFLSGKIDIWAASIIYAIGSTNFLSDKSFEPYATAADIADYFNVSKSTIGQKAKVIRDMFKMNYFSNEFTTNKMSDLNPFRNLGITEDGFIIPMSFFDTKKSNKDLLK